MPNCNNCGAPVRADVGGGVVCAHCGTVDPRVGAFYDLETAGPTTSSCPQCLTLLVEARIEVSPVRYCPSCHGLLVAMQHFVTLTDAVRAREPLGGVALPRRQQPGDRVLACPLCAQPMLSHVYGGPGNLVIDTCETCAVNWLDPGELRRIARAP